MYVSELDFFPFDLCGEKHTARPRHTDAGKVSPLINFPAANHEPRLFAFLFTAKLPCIMRLSFFLFSLLHTARSKLRAMEFIVTRIAANDHFFIFFMFAEVAAVNRCSTVTDPSSLYRTRDTREKNFSGSNWDRVWFPEKSLRRFKLEVEMF